MTGSVTGYSDVSTDSEQALTSTVAQQPMSVAEKHGAKQREGALGSIFQQQ